MHVSDFGFDFISAALQGIPQSVLHHDLLSGYERKEWRERGNPQEKKGRAHTKERGNTYFPYQKGRAQQIRREAGVRILKTLRKRLPGQTKSRQKKGKGRLLRPAYKLS